MKISTLKALFAIIILCFCPKNIFPQNIDTKHILLNLQFDWQKKQAFGYAEITILMLEESQKIYLDAGKLSIDFVELNKQKLNFKYDGGETDNNLEIILDKKYLPNQTFTLKITYKTNHQNHANPNAIWGSFGKGLRFQQPTSSTPNKRKQIWSSGEPDNNKYWFPCNEDIADIHTTEVIATIEKPLMLISNGQLATINYNKNNTATYHYKTEKPFPNYLVAIVVGEYTDIIQNSKGTIIHNFGYPDEAEAVTATVQLLPDMMQFLEEKTAYSYPFKTYSQIMVQDYPFPGLVGQHTASIISDNYIDDEGVHQDFKYLWDGVAMQALTNQWFGNLLMPKSWEDIWLNNAFGYYFAGLYTAKSNTQEEYFTYYHPFQKSNIWNDWNSENKHPIVTKNIKELANFTTDSYSKFRGAYILSMLQDEMGNELWWKTIQYYVKIHAYQQVSTKDFQNAVEKISQKSYQWFFDQWVYKIGLPTFEISKNYDVLQKKLSIHVKQTQKQENNTTFEQVRFFEGKVNVEIDNQIQSICLKPQAENTFVFALNKKPKFVNFNLHERFLGEVIFEKKYDEYLYQLQHSKDILAKQKALDKLVEMAKDTNKTNVEIKDKIIKTVTKEITSKQYWRYRNYALGSLQKIIPPPFDQKTISLLIGLAKNEKSWLKTSAINMLGKTNNKKFIKIYLKALQDKSDRVINVAAIALGKTKSPEVYEVLINLEKKPSWKNQSRISALNGLEQLNDNRAVNYALKCLVDNQSPRWYLATPVWDYPFAAVNTLVALGKAELGYPVLIARFRNSLLDDDLNDIFQNVQLINLLKDKRATEMYALLKEKYKNEATILEAVINYENQFLKNLPK